MQEAIDSTVLTLVEDIVEEWDLDLDRSVNLQDALIADLGFNSVDFVQLFVAIEDELDRKLGFHDLIMAHGKYVDDLMLSDVATFVKRKLSSQKVGSLANRQSPVDATTTEEKISFIKAEQFKLNIPPVSRPTEVKDKNQKAIFILCPSRSGSTLLRVMLAGNSQLFSPPELHLLSFETLLQRKRALGNDLNSHLLNGVVRAVMNIKKCSDSEAQEIIDNLESQNLTTQEFYRILQHWLGDKILIDKTPSYAYHTNFLRRSEAYFSDALYIHLLRHPYGTIRSFEDAKMDRLLPFMQSDAFSRREYAELAWLVCHQNILEFLHEVPAHRQLRVKFEDLVSKPDGIAQQICRFLGVDFCASMLNPYEDKNHRMTDGVQAASKMSGDLKFHLHSQIDSDIASRWQQYYSSDFLGEITWQVAERIGYAKPTL